MKLTLKQLFDRYPLKINGVAERMGRSREWLSHITLGHIHSENDLPLIEDEIRKIGDELSEVVILKRDEKKSVD